MSFSLPKFVIKWWKTSLASKLQFGAGGWGRWNNFKKWVGGELNEFWVTVAQHRRVLAACTMCYNYIFIWIWYVMIGECGSLYMHIYRRDVMLNVTKFGILCRQWKEGAISLKSRTQIWRMRDCGEIEWQKFSVLGFETLKISHVNWLSIFVTLALPPGLECICIKN